MKGVYKHKTNTEAGKAPLPTDLVEGEIAINLHDKTVYTKNEDGEVIQLGSDSADIDFTKIDSVSDILQD